MAHETLNDLMLHELQDVYDAEHQITKALPKMIEMASSTDLKRAFQHHLEQTAGQIVRLDQVFSLMGEEAKRKPCKAMQGLIAEGEDLMNDHHTSALLDVGLIGSAQRVEHYEIAVYSTLSGYAETLGKHHIATLLQQTLDEEKQTNQALTELGVPINRHSAQVPSESHNGNNKTLGGALGNVLGNIFGNGSANDSHADRGNNLVTENDKDLRNRSDTDTGNTFVTVPMPGNMYGAVPANVVGVVVGNDFDIETDTDLVTNPDADKDFYKDFGNDHDTNVNNDRDTNMSNDPASNFGNDFGNTSATDFDNAAVTDFHKYPATDFGNHTGDDFGNHTGDDFGNHTGDDFGNHTGDDFDAVYSNDADNDFTNDPDADFQKSNRSPSPKNTD